MEEPEDITCPFCGDVGFDKIGLKMHIQLWCNEYKNTTLPERVIDLSKFVKE